MPTKKPLVIVTRKLPEAIETRMMELFDARLSPDDTPMTPAQLVDAVKEADVLVPTVTDTIDSGILAQAGPRLKLIASFGTGVDHIDLATARQRGITVTNTPGVLTEDTADMTMALILGVARRLSEGERLLRSGKWAGWGPTPRPRRTKRADYWPISTAPRSSGARRQGSGWRNWGCGRSQRCERPCGQGRRWSRGGGSRSC